MLDARFPLILMDSGDCCVRRFYMLKHWYRMSHPRETADQAWSENKEFMNKYRTRYLDSIVKIANKFKTPLTNVIIAEDDSRRDLFRTKIDSGYKADRIYDVELNKVLKIAYESFIPEILKTYHIKSARVKGLEADDIMACIARYAMKEFSKIYVISADKDLTQLREKYGDKVQQFTIAIKPVISKQSLLEHIVLGDASDGVASCLKPGQGHKYLSGLIANDGAGLQALSKSDPNFARCFERNMRLIDFDYIPDPLSRQIKKKINRWTRPLLKTH